MNRLIISVTLVWWTMAAEAAASDAAAADRPNVVFLLSDDQCHDTIHALGNPDTKTPNVDRLVERGFTFRNTYCMGAMQGAVCVPSRAMLLSGRSLFRVPVDLPASVRLLPQVLRQAGYRDHGIGKWHNGPPSYARAFSGGGPVFFGGMANHDRLPVSDFDSTGKYEKSQQRIGEKFSSELFADAAIRFLTEHKEVNPFFLYVAFTAPHDPRMPPKDFAALYYPAMLTLPKSFLPQHPFNNGDMTLRDEQLAPWPRTPEVVRQHIADYYGMISHLDAQVGRILHALEKSQHAKNTMIVFTGDSGLAVGKHGLFGKQNLYEHSMKPPLIVAGPDIPARQQSTALCYLFDLFPTICDYTGVALPDGLEGMSLRPIIEGKQAKGRDAIFGAYRQFQRSVRDERWKLIRYPHINKSQLFDLQHDPDELHDLAEKPMHAAELRRMMTLLEAKQREFGDRQTLSTDKPAPVQIELKNEKKP